MYATVRSHQKQIVLLQLLLYGLIPMFEENLAVAAILATPWLQILGRWVAAPERKLKAAQPRYGDFIKWGIPKTSQNHGCFNTAKRV